MAQLDQGHSARLHTASLHPQRRCFHRSGRLSEICHSKALGLKDANKKGRGGGPHPSPSSLNDCPHVLSCAPTVGLPPSQGAWFTGGQRAHLDEEAPDPWCRLPPDGPEGGDLGCGPQETEVLEEQGSESSVLSPGQAHLMTHICHLPVTSSWPRCRDGHFCSGQTTRRMAVTPAGWVHL